MIFVSDYGVHTVAQRPFTIHLGRLLQKFENLWYLYNIIQQVLASEKLYYKDKDKILCDRKRVCGKLWKTDVGRIIIFVGTSPPPIPPVLP